MMVKISHVKKARKTGAFLILSIFSIMHIDAATAPVYASEDARRIEEEKRSSLIESETEILKSEDRLILTYGGWINYRYDDYNEDDNDSSLSDSIDYSNSMDTRFWLRASFNPLLYSEYENRHSIYVRIKDLSIDRRPDDTAGGNDHDGPHIDYAYLTLDARPLWVIFGRYYFTIGKGIAYSNSNDGIEMIYYESDWSMKAFVSKTLPHEINIDTSIPGYTKSSQRHYYGAEIDYLGIPEQKIYTFALIQRDRSSSDPTDPQHEYTYDSEYFGAGAAGTILSRLRYTAEAIKESGESIVYSTDQKADIDAWAVNASLAYDLLVYSRPTISAEYGFGSGDPDRISVTDTEDGNRVGDDNNFSYFGYIDTGYALSPRLSNLHFYKFSLSSRLLEAAAIFEDCIFTTSYYLYYKHEKTGGIFDIDAIEEDSDIGWELDFSVDWKIFSDLSCELQYGYFQPKEAYPASTNDSEVYFSVSTTVTF